MKKRYLVLFVGTVLAIACYASAQPAITLSDLLEPTATIVSGDKLFYGFDSYTSSAAGPGAVPVNPADITVTPYYDVVYQEYGLLFASNTILITGSPSGLGLSFEYFVTPTDPRKLISNNTLTMSGTVSAGQIFISETATTVVGDVLASKLTVMMPFVSILTDHEVYSVPSQIVHVQKTIGLDKASGGPNQLLSFTQTFSQIPEPASIALFGAGAVTIWRRRKA